MRIFWIVHGAEINCGVMAITSGRVAVRAVKALIF